MSHLDSLRIHAHIEDVSAPFDDGKWVGIKFKFEHRDDLQGECRVNVWTQDAGHYHVGQELCGAFYPKGHHAHPSAIRIHAHIEDVSAPFDDAQWVEIKLKLDDRDDIYGACRIRIWTKNAAAYHVGQELCAAFLPIGLKR